MNSSSHPLTNSKEGGKQHEVEDNSHWRCKEVQTCTTVQPLSSSARMLPQTASDCLGVVHRVCTLRKFFRYGRLYSGAQGTHKLGLACSHQMEMVELGYMDDITSKASHHDDRNIKYDSHVLDDPVRYVSVAPLIMNVDIQAKLGYRDDALSTV